jgi:hypothetical protein
MASHSLDRPLPRGETTDATEADADLAVRIQPKQARLNRPIATAPTARVLWFDVVATDCSRLQVETLALYAASETLRPTRMLFPLGSVSVNSCMPQGMSSTGVTCNPAATNRACHPSASSVMT